jgi:amino acid adenylation domain-containing protein
VSIAEFVSHLQALDIRLSAEGKRLRVNAPKDVLTDGLRVQIAERKHELLEFLRDYGQSAAFAPPPILRQTTGGSAPLSFAQERLWFLEQLEPGTAVYNICRASRLIGQLNLSALEASLNEIVRRHEVLRSAIRVTDGRPVQIVHAPFKLKISFADLQPMADREREQEISIRIQDAAHTPFDFSDGRFLRAALLRVCDDEHVLILTTHHLMADAWSMGILTHELWSLYESQAKGEPARLPNLSVQYSNYAVWQREWLQGEVLEQQLSYWREQLKDSRPTLDLPTDRPRPRRQSFRGATIAIVIPDTLTTAINRLSQRERVTPYMMLLAVFNVLLYRYTRQEDIIVGSPIANRQYGEIDTLIGYFVNTFVLRTHISGSLMFKDLLRHVRDVCLGAYAHQDLPFEKLVTELNLERSLSHNPLFQVMFVLQNAPTRSGNASNIKIDPIAVDTRTAKFDLTLALREREGRLIGFFEYSTDLFDRSTIERMAGHFQTLLQGIVANSDERISNMPILTEPERNRLLLECNDTKANYPKYKYIHELYEEQVKRTPEAIAVSFDRQQLTYREMNTRANQLAHYLRGLGVGSEELVGVCIERSLEMVVALLGILKAGGAYLPLDPDYPKERLRFMLEDAKVRVVVTQEKHLAICSQSGLSRQPTCVLLDPAGTVVAHERAANPWNENRTETLAYVIYTSGSSGQPKGVKVNHHSVVNLFYATQSKLGFDKTDVWTGFHSYAFDFSVWEIWGCLLSGGRLVIVPLQLTRSPDGFLELLSRERVTVLNQTPTAISQLVERMSVDSDIPDLNLRLIICGGELLTPTLATSLLKWGIPLWNFYGPTETTVWSTIHEITLTDANDLFVSIGRPLANTKIYILDPELQLVPIGVPGEICISGAGLARGYLNNPELTAQKFVPNPFEKGKRLYKTGDLARYLTNGNIQFLGRLDNQVKVRGYRVELGEIEATLRQHAAIEEAVVVLWDDASEKDARTNNLGSETTSSAPICRMIAYIVSADQNLSIAEVRAFLREKLPEYMMPSTFLFLDSLPVSANGKIDRQALPVPKDLRSGLEYVRAEPRTPIEEMLAEIWKEVLKLDSVSVNANFFELGGHSLLAIQIISRVRDTFDKDVSIHAMFEMPTIAGLASSLENTDDRSSNYLPPITRVPRDKPPPLSMNQEHLWHLDQIISGTHFFNVPYVHRVTGVLNIIALEKALREVIRRHAALRTVFGHENGRPFQIIKKVTDFRLPIIDFRSADPDAASEGAADVILQERTQPFDLAHGPLIRIKLLCLPNNEYLLLVTMHHIITDEWSMRVFFKELTALYDAYFQRRQPPLNVPPIQHADFAHWERELLNRGLLEGQLNYWRMQLSGRISELKFKKGRKTTELKSFRTRSVAIEFDEDLCSDIREVAHAGNATPFIVVLAALNILLYQCTEQRDIRIGTIMANRGRKESENVIGHFMNTIVLRNKIDRKLTFRQCVKQVGTEVRSALTNQDLPFNHLAHVLEQERGIHRANLVPIMFIYHKRSSDAVRLPGTTFAPVGWQYPGPDTSVMITSCDLVINMWEMKAKIVGTVNYKPDEFGNEVVAEMVTRLSTILKRMVANMGEAISSLNKVSGQLQHLKGERRQ